ncbi:hypothetical protein HGG75_10395 [Ochrobactrum pseudogrignonense]|nr:hypothetical protein [Brucella pseudogrignonensis]
MTFLLQEESGCETEIAVTSPEAFDNKPVKGRRKNVKGRKKSSKRARARDRAGRWTEPLRPCELEQHEVNHGS